MHRPTLALALICALVALVSAARTVWVPYSTYPGLTYGSSPATTILTSSHQIYNPVTYCADPDTYVDQADANHTEQQFNTQQMALTQVIRGGAIIGAPNISYNATTGTRTVTYTVEGPNLQATGTEATFVDTFTWTDGAPNPIKDAAAVTNNTVIHRYPVSTEENGDTPPGEG